MKKVFVLLALAAMFSFAACNSSNVEAVENDTVDSITVSDSASVVDSVQTVDSVAKL